jgi:hypothetical protein
MKIRLHGTAEECHEVTEILERVMLVEAVSDPSPARGRSVYVRVYIDAVPRDGDAS